MVGRNDVYETKTVRRQRDAEKLIRQGWEVAAQSGKENWVTGSDLQITLRRPNPKYKGKQPNTVAAEWSSILKQPAASVTGTQTTPSADSTMGTPPPSQPTTPTQQGPQKPIYKRPWFWPFVVIVIIVVIVAASKGGGSPSSAGSSSAAQSATTATTAVNTETPAPTVTTTETIPPPPATVPSEPMPTTPETMAPAPESLTADTVETYLKESYGLTADQSWVTLCLEGSGFYPYPCAISSITMDYGDLNIRVQESLSKADATNYVRAAWNFLCATDSSAAQFMSISWVEITDTSGGIKAQGQKSVSLLCQSR